jgi:hypothetical protein
VVESVDGSPATVTVSAPSGVLFKICATATEQITRPRCQVESVELPTWAYGNFAPKAAPWLQSSGGTRSFVSGAEVAAAERLRRFSLTKVSRECDAVLAIEERRQGYINPVAAATTRNADGTVATYRTVYQEEDAETSTAHRWPVEHLVDPVAESSTSRSYDSAGYLSRTVEESYGYRNVERAVRLRASRSTAWDAATGPAGLLSLADGTGVVQSVETYQRLQRVETEFGQDTGYQTFIRATTFGYRKRAGWQYLYADGSESSDEREQWGVVKVVEETWTRLAEEGLHMYRREERGPDGKLARNTEESDVVEIREGEPPAAEKVEDVDPQLADFDTLDEWRDALASSHWETRELLVRRVRSGLPHPYREAEISADYVETAAGLEAFVDRSLIKSAAMPVKWTALPIPGVKLGDVAHLRVRAQLTLPGETAPRDVSLDHDVFIDSMRWVGSESGAAVLLELGGSIR